MPIYVGSNTKGFLNNINKASNSLNDVLTQLSTGNRLAVPGSSPAAVAVASTLDAQVRGWQMAQNNIQTGINVANIADGALGSIQENLLSLRDLAVQASNGTVTDYTAYVSEYTGLVDTINAVANGISYEGKDLLKGTITLTLQVGPDTGSTNTVDLGGQLSDNRTAALGITSSPTSQANANTLITQVDAALVTLGSNRAKVGSTINQLESRMDMAEVASVNYSASFSSIRDTDVAAATAEMTRQELLMSLATQSFQKRLSSDALVLQLLQGAFG